MDLPEVWKGNRGAFIISRHQIPESSTLKIWKLQYNAVPKSEYFSMFQQSNIHHCKGNAPTLHQITKISRIGLFEHYINNVTHQAAASSTSVFLLSEFHPQFDWEKKHWIYYSRRFQINTCWYMDLMFLSSNLKSHSLSEELSMACLENEQVEHSLWWIIFQNWQVIPILLGL